MTKVTVELDISDCRDCVFRSSHYGHGECWKECVHPDSPRSYGNILWGCQEQFKAVPKWCPIKLHEKSHEELV